MKERLISYQFYVLDWFIYVRFDHTFPCCIGREKREIFQSMSEISASNFVVAYVRKQAGIK